MLNLLLVSPKKESLSDLTSGLATHGDVRISWAESGKKALEIISDTSVDMVISDEKLGDMTGLELAESLLRINPLTNCALISTLSTEEFHEAGEGLGIMTQLPISPGADHADKLLNRLKKIVGSLKEQPFQNPHPG